MNRASPLRFFVPAVLVLLSATAAGGDRGEGCSTVVFGPASTRDGGPMLWKNRDSDFPSNKVVFVGEQPYAYLALVNNGQPSGRWVYAGLNAAGFAIMNSVAYNLPQRAGDLRDLEGQIIADALRTCRTAGDFEAYLQANLGPDLGSRANFGVIDGEGRAWLFEVHNRGFRKIDAAAQPGGYLVNTNFSRSGPENEGAGYLRFERVSGLLREGRSGFDPEFVFTRLARDFGHPLLQGPTRADLARRSGASPFWHHSNHCIDRDSTSAAVVLQGRSGSDWPPATMWVMLGEPLVSVAVPVWVEAGEVPPALWQGDDAPLVRETLRLKKIVRPFAEPDKAEYIDLSRLDNRERSGLLPGLLGTEREIRIATASFLKARRSAAELAAFQREMAQKALAALQAAREGPA